MALTNEHLMAALRTVNDPELHRDLVSLDMVKKAEVQGTDAHITIELTTPACPLKDRIKADVTAAIKAKAAEVGAEEPTVNIELTADVRTPQERIREDSNPLPAVKQIIAVGAGKGGVGKSTIAVSLARWPRPARARRWA
jgi:ATP-binding protein involved in chromosome partitioning